jgi:mRNA interferase MazF
MATIARGDIVLTRFPFTDLSGSAVRPALVISRGLIAADVVLVGISSVVRGSIAPTDCLIEPAHPEFPGTGLKVRSVVRVHKIAAVEDSLLVRRLGQLGNTLQVHIDNLLRQVLGL